MAESKRKATYTKISSPTGIIEGIDVDFKIIKEDWNIYELDDGTRIKVKTIVTKISKGIDPRTNDAYLLPTSEPMFAVTPTMTVSAEFPREVLEKLAKK